MSASLWIAVAVAGVVSLLAPLLFRPMLVKVGVVDIPNERSSHVVPTIRGGGLGPLAGMLVGGALALAWYPGNSGSWLLTILFAAFATGILGFVEDIKGLPVLVRAGSQLLIGLAVAGFLASEGAFEWLWLPLLGLGFAANVNFTNFMDGINGISSLHGLVAGIAYAIIGAVNDNTEVTVAGLLTAVIFIAFLPWNLSKRRMFLGDVGSYLLGGLLAGIAIVLLAYGVPLFVAVAPLTVYWADTVTVILRRVAKREPVFEAHRTHVYQRLTPMGLSHLKVACIVATFTATCGAVGILGSASDLGWVPISGLLAIFALIYLLLPRLRTYKISRRNSSSIEEN